jgi:hypothetical protein
MDFYERHDELLNEMRNLKYMEKEIKLKQKMLERRLTDPSISVFKAHSAFVFTENQIDVMIKKHEWFMRFLNSLPYDEWQVIEGILSGVNIFHFADSIGTTTAIIYQRVYSVLRKYAKYKEIAKGKVKEDGGGKTMC